MKSKECSKQTSLLTKTLCQFALCASFCFALTAPLFYLLTKYFYAEDVMDVIEAVEQGKSMPHIDMEEDIIAGMMLQFVLIFVVLTLALFITLRFATKKLWLPFDNTLKKVEQFNLAQSEVPVFDDTDIQEFVLLNHSLKQLMMKDKETYRIQKEFTENASHELQTPLAIMRSKLDLLMQEDLGEKEMNIVSDMCQMTMRLGHLNRSLLMLAKIENAQYAAKEDVNVGMVLSESLHLYEALLDGRMLQLEDLRKDKGRTLLANPVLLECLLKNLIVNAIRHSVPDGAVRVELLDECLAVGNMSPDGKPLPADMLFRRFGTNADMRHKGNGLGLAIVKAICDFHGWNVAYRFDERGWHLFVVGFCGNDHPS